MSLIDAAIGICVSALFTIACGALILPDGFWAEFRKLVAGESTIAATEKGETMSSKSKKHRRTPMMSITKATTAAEVMFVWAWMECFHPGPEDVQRMKESLNNVAESVTLGNLRIKDIKEAIRDEHGWEIQ
nr:MAG TPA: hypothetical protein [Caudoviricetes sp.]